MALIVPTLSDYEDAEKEIIEFFDDSEFFHRVWQKVDYIIYGSQSTNKVRRWLSDIDMMMIAHTDDLLFPFDISEAFFSTKQTIESLGIPLQVNYCTTWLLKSPIFAPDYEYLKEVIKWIERWKSSSDVSGLFKEHRDLDVDDLNMIRFFLRKVNTIPQNISEMGFLLMRAWRWIEHESLDENYQRKLWHCWDNFKKMISLITIVIRIRENDSLFSESDTQILEKFNTSFWINTDISQYIEILKSIKDIWDWHNFLENNSLQGLDIVKDMYKNIFLPMINSIDKNMTA